MAKPAIVPIHGKAHHNAGFLVAIGGLVVNWANNESVFMAMLQTLIGEDRLSASIVWHSHRTTQARLQLVTRLVREQVKDLNLVSDIENAISQFKGFSRVRHFYCHATYTYDDDLCLRQASGASFPQDGEAIRFEDKPMNKATLNEISDTSIKLGTFNRETWKLVERLQASLGRQRVKLPSLLSVPPDPETHPPKDEVPKP
jgi:hypothetical protein